MPATNIRGRQILDGDVSRVDLNVSTSSNAVIRKLLPASDASITISSTGTDVGTGDVTLISSKATASQLGMIRVGSGLSVDVNGILSISGSSGVTGSGTTNYISKWSSVSALANSIIFDDGISVSIGSTSPLYKLTVQPASNINFGVGKATFSTTDDSIFLNAVNNTYGSVPMVMNAAHIGLFIGFSEAMRINSSKNILINTTSGVSGGGVLQVNGDVNISGSFKVNGTVIGGGGGGNISGSGSINRLPVFTDATVIGNSNIGTSIGLDGNAYTSIYLNLSSSNAGSLTFKAGTSTAEMVIEAYSNVINNYASLTLKSSRVYVTNKLNVGDLTTSGLIVGDLYVDSNGFVKRANSAT